MIRFFNLTVFFFLSHETILAQISHSINIGPSIGLPTENLNAAKAGWGGSIEYTAKFSASVGAHIDVGYTHFTNKHFSSEQLSFLPVRAGVTGFIYQDQIFVTADAGISFFHSKASSGYSKSGLSYGFGAGYKIYFDPEKKPYVQVSVNYNIHKYKNKSYGQNYNYNWVNIGLAYGLTWGRKIVVRQPS